MKRIFTIEVSDHISGDLKLHCSEQCKYFDWHDNKYDGYCELFGEHLDGTIRTMQCRINDSRPLL